MAAEPERTKMLRLAEEAQEQSRRERLIFQENEMTKLYEKSFEDEDFERQRHLQELEAKL